MDIDRCTKQDFDRIIEDHADFWDSELTLRLHHPIFLFEFGDTAYVVRDGGTIAAYLLGFYSQTEPVGYVHMVAARRSYQRRGLARRLYEHFIEAARTRGCTELKATSAPDNLPSIRFHAALGMTMQGVPYSEGVSVVKDYLRPGVDRVVFRMPL